MSRIQLAGALAILLGIPVWSQQNTEDPADAANHGAVRIGFLTGDASVARGDSGESSAAVLNDALVTGDRLVTNNARAELQFDALNVLRVGPDTEVRMGEVGYEHYLVQVAHGLVTLRVLGESPAQTEISLPNSSLRPRQPGVYRILVRPDGNSEITVRSGDAEIFSATGSEMLQAGASLFSRGPIDNPEFMTAQAIPLDDWDRFNADRDRALERVAQTDRYANPGPDVAGMEDLNGYGRWSYDPDYGNVWIPNVGQDWAPYTDGRWDWLDYYGWNWVSYEPWGWAPFHYGRWYHGAWGWSWYPGFNGRGAGITVGFGGRHYWRPALVGFVGWGAPAFGSSFTVGFGNIGWVPLAPHEAFRPWYGPSFTGNRGAMFAGGFNAVGAYRNARFNGVTGVSAGEFGRTGRYLRPSGGDVARAGLIGTPEPPAGRAYSSSIPARSYLNRSAGSNGFAGGRTDNTRFFSSQSAVSAGAQAGGWHRFPPQTASGQAVRINPSIVNMRTPGVDMRSPGVRSSYAPRGPAEYGGFGGPRPSAPSPVYQAPRYSAPPSAPHYSAPPAAPRYSAPPRPAAGGGGYRGGGARNNGGHR